MWPLEAEHDAGDADRTGQPFRIENFSMATDPRVPELPEWLQELYPYRIRHLQLGPWKMSLVDEGPPGAPVFLLLHGNPTWSFLYRDLIARLRGKYRVIAPDTIGFGLSDKPAVANYHTLAQHISNLTRLIEALALRNVSLVMTGAGGPIGLGYAVRFPQNVARLVMASTWGPNLPRPRHAQQPLGVRLAGKGKFGAWLDSLLNLTMHSMFATRTARPLNDLALEAYTFPFREPGSRVALRAFSQMFYDPDGETTAKLDEIHAGLKNITAPAHIVFGAEDRALGKLPAYLLRDSLKNAREPVFVPGAAHFLPEEAPEAFANFVLRAVEQDGPKGRPGSIFKILDQ